MVIIPCCYRRECFFGWFGLTSVVNVCERYQPKSKGSVLAKAGTDQDEEEKAADQAARELRKVCPLPHARFVMLLVDLPSCVLLLTHQISFLLLKSATIARRRKKRRERQREEFLTKLKTEGRLKPGAQPDPDRWLPRWMRKKNRKKRGARGGGGSKAGGAQGAGDASARDADQFDLAAQVRAGTAGKNKPNSTAGTQAKGKASSGRKNKNNKNRRRKKKK